MTAVECKYKVSTTFADLITIFVRVEEFKGVKLKLKYEMKNTASDLENNAIMQEFDAMYDREQGIIYGE